MKTVKYKNKFAFLKKKIKISDKLSLEKNEVGIIESETKSSALIFFVKAWQKIELNKNDFRIFDVNKTGDAFSKKICNICYKLLDTNKFAKNQNGINNRSVRRPSCADCRKHLEGTNMSTKTK